MKYVLKIGIILVICISIVFILPNEFSFVCAAGSTSYKGLLGKATPKDGDMPTTTSGVTGINRKLLGFLQVASALMSVLVIAFTGFQYIVSADAEMKNEMKKKMLPIIIGLILVFFATSITTFLLGAVGG